MTLLPVYRILLHLCSTVTKLNFYLKFFRVKDIHWLRYFLNAVFELIYLYTRAVQWKMGVVEICDPAIEILFLFSVYQCKPVVIIMFCSVFMRIWVTSCWFSPLKFTMPNYHDQHCAIKFCPMRSKLTVSWKLYLVRSLWLK